MNALEYAERYNLKNTGPEDLLLSLDSFDDLIMIANDGRASLPSDSQDFRGGIDFDTALAKLETGDPDLAAQAAELLESILDSAIVTERPEWQAAPSGAYTIVPEVLAGEPFAMRHRTRDESAYAPIGLYVNTSVWCQASQQDIADRGVAIMALLIKLQDIRPVDLYVVIGQTRIGRTGNTVIVTRVPSRPVDLSVAAFLFAHPGYQRNIGHAATQAVSPDIDSRLPFAQAEFQKNGMRRFVGMGDQDIYVPMMGSRNLREIVGDPTRWVNDRIRDVLNGTAAQSEAERFDMVQR